MATCAAGDKSIVTCEAPYNRQTAISNKTNYDYGYEDGLLEAEKQLIPKIQMAQDILKACIEIERSVNGTVQNEYTTLINSANPYVDNTTILQDAVTLANAIKPGSCL